MTTLAPPAPPMAPGPPGPLRRVQIALHRRTWLRLLAVLGLPVTWLVLVYLVPLGLLLLTSLCDTDSFTGLLVRELTLDNFRLLVQEPAYLRTVLRTVAVAAAVTVLCALLAVPMALFMAHVASRRWQPVLVALVLTPLWASYLVKVYAWRSMLAPDQGLIDTALAAVGLRGPGYGWPRSHVHDARRRARDVLPGDRLQQRRGAAAANGGQPRGGLHGPRRDPAADLPLRHLPGHPQRVNWPVRCWRSRCRSTRSS